MSSRRIAAMFEKMALSRTVSITSDIMSVIAPPDTCSENTDNSLLIRKCRHFLRNNPMIV
jgi:hypothetical protein